MVNKKYILYAGILSTLALGTGYAQESTQASWSGRDLTYRGEVYDALDTAYIPKSRMERHQQYLNHQYAFPAMPRNMWEIGLTVGQVNIMGDVTSKGFWNAPKFNHALAYGVSIRKALGYATSIRLNYNYMNATGFDYRAREIYTEPLWQDYNGYPNTTGSYVYSNYKFRSHEASLQLVGAINNIKFHRAQNTMSLYGFVGAGAMVWQTWVSTLNENGVEYDFEQFRGKRQADIDPQYKEWLRTANNYNHSYTRANYTGGGHGGLTIGDNAVSPILVGGVGVQFKLGKRISLQIEDKITWAGLDHFDAVTMDPTPFAGLSPDKDIINHVSIGLGINIGNKQRSVAPLWWVNPMDHIYNELADPRHMNLPDPVLPDSDGDGVTDQFDRCPDTPEGVAVDTHGCPLDTDGDGVPDYRDKQLITPTECQPVDADGIGKCPCPDGCGGGTACNFGAGIINFAKNSTSLNSQAQNQLAVVATQMKASPNCKLVVVGNPGKSKIAQQRSWDRVNAVIEHLSNVHQISRDQFIFQYQGGTGDENSIMYRAALPDEEGPSNIPPPHPQLGSRN